MIRSSSGRLTIKQETFCLMYLQTGNATEAYRRAYDAMRMTPRTVEKRAGDLLKNGVITGRIAELQAKAADAAVLDRAWVLSRLMRNATIAMGEQPIRLKIKNTNKETKEITVTEIEITDRNGAEANRALELLGKTDEVKLFIDRIEATGKDGKALVPEPEHTDRDVARAITDILRCARIAAAPEPNDGNG